MAHGDFYFTLNATWYHFTDRWGEQALVEYWQTLGSEYLRPLAHQFEAGGPAEIARHWSEHFAGEPGGDVDVMQPDAHTVVLNVRVCPALRWLRESPAAAVHRPPHPMYCRHCRHVTDAMLAGTGYRFELEGGNGRCRQTFTRVER